MQSVNVQVYGTFQFQGLEKSPLAGALNLMDLVSFRELYGFLSGEKLAEIRQLQKAARRPRGEPRERRGGAVRQRSRPADGRPPSKPRARSRRPPRPASRR